MSVLLYIHGFLSSPASEKAQQVETWCEQHQPSIKYLCPALSAYPDDAISTLEGIVRSHRSEPIYIIGSSLGGFYATYLVEKYGLKAVLVNPAIRPFELIKAYIDTDLKNYHTEEVYRLNTTHMESLRSINVESLALPENYWLMAQTGDETLDYREAVKKYEHCLKTIEQGGDHSFQNFEQWLPRIFDFFTAQ